MLKFLKNMKQYTCTLFHLTPFNITSQEKVFAMHSRLFWRSKAGKKSLVIYLLITIYKIYLKNVTKIYCFMITIFHISETSQTVLRTEQWASKSMFRTAICLSLPTRHRKISTNFNQFVSLVLFDQVSFLRNWQYDWF